MTTGELKDDLLHAADELRQLAPAERADALQQYDQEKARRIFEQLEAPLQEELLPYLSNEQVLDLVEALDPDDRVRLLDAMPEEVAVTLLNRLNLREWRLTNKLLSFPEESAGRIMNPEYLPLQGHLSVEAALKVVHLKGSRVDSVDALPVLDSERRLVGLVKLSSLVLADPVQSVAEVMLAPVPTARPDTDQEEVARLIQAADLLALPVVNETGHLLGLVTVDDAMDIVQQEQEEDFAHAAASERLDRPYFSISVLGLTRARLVWLLLLAVAGVLTVNVLSIFETLLEEAISLSLFIPLLIGIGGNSGAQSSTTVIRAMATGSIRGSGLMKVVVRETSVGLLLGTGLSLLAYAPVHILFGPTLAITVALTLIAICTLATLVGSSMPLLARRVGIDPAVISAPTVTTLVDASGLLVYFLIAKAIMGL